MAKPMRTPEPDYPVMEGAALVTLQRWVEGLQPFYKTVRRKPAGGDPAERVTPPNRPIVRVGRIRSVRDLDGR